MAKWCVPTPKMREEREREQRQFRLTYPVPYLQPLLHAIVFIIQFTMCTILVRKFNGYYSNRPVLTTMITNAVSTPTSPSLVLSLT
jgi:hypothetical protein